MHIISRKKLLAFGKIYADAEDPLEVWYRLAKRGRWQNLAELRQTFPHADPYCECTIFNVGENKYRLIAKVYYEDQTILVRFVLTHAEYDREKWKDDCNC